MLKLALVAYFKRFVIECYGPVVPMKDPVYH